MRLLASASGESTTTNIVALPPPMRAIARRSSLAPTLSEGSSSMKSWRNSSRDAVATESAITRSVQSRTRSGRRAPRRANQATARSM